MQWASNLSWSEPQSARFLSFPGRMPIKVDQSNKQPWGYNTQFFLGRTETEFMHPENITVSTGGFDFIHTPAIPSSPDKVEYNDLRKNVRVSCLISAEICVKSELFDGLISNISAEGCGFTFNKIDYEELPRLKVNDQIEITIHFRKEVEAVVFSATLRTVSMDIKRMSIGLLFNKPGVNEQDTKGEKALQDAVLELVKSL
jgi:hypothetical protein